MWLVALVACGGARTPPVPPAASAPSTAPLPPRLVLQIVVDQLRPDLLDRARHGLGEGGFHRLWEGGFAYTDAHNRQATTLTAVAHATIGTGAHTREHGIVGNEWFDRELQQQVPSVRDHDQRIVGEDSIGRSPFRLLAPTLGDELTAATEGKAKVFGVSAKDRSAILITGASGMAYWYSYSTGRQVTSTYYREDYPEWVTAWNAANPVSAHQQSRWELRHPAESYVSRDDRPEEGERYGVKGLFPKDLGEIEPEHLANALRHTPILDERTASFALELIERESLGRDEVPDLLSVSFSATDFIGHTFGPMSLEQEENLIRLDGTLSRFLARLDGLGLMEHTVVVLTADHGVDQIPETRRGPEGSTGRAVPEVFVPQLDAHLGQVFATDRSLVRSADRFRAPYVYLDHGAIDALGLDAKEVQTEAAAFVERQPGIARAIPRHAIEERTLTDGFAEQVYRSFHPQRSGDLHLVAERHWYLNNRSDGNKATHGSPHEYDSHVPLVVYGAGIEPGTSARRVGLSDIAPTLAELLSIPKPSKATGTPLVEVLE